jgi:Membrane protein involved in the export of O-antigen and teichoic acid
MPTESPNVARNALWNVSGTLVSLLVGLIALPVLLHALGAARLGVFTLALGLIGFSGLLDMGLGRALTQGVSSAMGAGRPRIDVAAMVWHVLRLLMLLGLVWTAVLWIAAPWLVGGLLSLTGEMARETTFGLRAVALSIPFALVATCAMGALEGLQRFGQVSSWRAAMSIAQFGLPALTALWRPDVGLVIAALAATRILSLVIWLRAVRNVLPASWRAAGAREDLRRLLRFGGWLSISNLIGPLMVYADRFYLASQFPLAAVAHYTVPYDSLYRTTALPYTAMNAVFPAIAAEQNYPEHRSQMLRTASRAMVALMLPPVIIGAVFARPLLDLWLGATFAAPATPVLKLLLVGIFLNGCSHVPYAFLQANGRTDLTAKLHILELPVFVVLLVWGVHVYGVPGAALAWTMRVALDTGLLFATASWFSRRQRAALSEGSLFAVGGTLYLIVATFSDNRMVQFALLLIALGLCTFVAFGLLQQWRRLTNPVEGWKQ